MAIPTVLMTGKTAADNWVHLNQQMVEIHLVGAKTLPHCRKHISHF
uniref:Uncharacterized protein n=1 Tax=Rhizophora mucronata TaxID=61149 RepID=A0A2P2QAV7_RHIMU